MLTGEIDMKTDGGLENLIASAQAHAREAIIDTHEQVCDEYGESPIEQLFLTAMLYRGFGGMHELLICPLKNDEGLPEVESQRRRFLFMRHQMPIERWRADFVFYAWDNQPRILKKPGWRELVVECDGHNFHERTKQQAARDRARDRAMVLNDKTVFRFTGSELWKDSWGCAGQVFDWAVRSYG